MGATPLAEVAFLLDGFGEGVETLETAVPLADSPNVVMGVYRFTEDETMVLFLGAAVPVHRQPFSRSSVVSPNKQTASPTCPTITNSEAKALSWKSYKDEFEELATETGFRLKPLHGDYAYLEFADDSPFMIWLLENVS